MSGGGVAVRGAKASAALVQRELHRTEDSRRREEIYPGGQARGEAHSHLGLDAPSVSCTTVFSLQLTSLTRFCHAHVVDTRDRYPASITSAMRSTAHIPAPPLCAGASF